MAELLRIGPSFYGISMVPKDVWVDYGYALLAIAGSDGDVSDPELEWLTIDLAESVGVDDEVVAKWEEFDYEDADLQSLFSEISARSFASYNKLLIYDAIRMSYADDDYADEEREKVGEAAAILQVNREAVISIEALVEMERAADKMRLLIF